MKMTYPADWPRYTTTGAVALQGDKATVNDTGEHVFIRVIGKRGYVTVMAPDIHKPNARVFHITDLSPGHN